MPEPVRISELADGDVAALRRRLSAAPVSAVRSTALVTVPCALEDALGASAGVPARWVTLERRLIVVQWRSDAGGPVTLLWDPVMDPMVAAGPYRRARGGRLPRARTREPKPHLDVESALGALGLRPEDVDLVAFPHLQGTDLRPLTGTTVAAPGFDRAHLARFPNAAVVVQRVELETAREPHPVARVLYEEDAFDGLDEVRLRVVDGDVELGPGCALIATPGRSPGHQSLCVATSEGIYVISANGVAADCWQPQLSQITGVSRWSAAPGREVIVAQPALAGQARQYDSMRRELGIADASRDDPRWAAVIPSAEMVPRPRHVALSPTFQHGGIAHGRIERVEARERSLARSTS